jgi:hypothetical protein
MKTLHSKWQDDRIVIIELDKLTPMDLHLDDRYLTRDLPIIQQQGLWYPLLVYRVDPVWWNNIWTKHRSAQCRYIDPVINRDGTIWAVKMGSNRYQTAMYLGYDSIDVIVCKDADECVKIGKWFAQCNPLNNTNGLPYMDLYDYEHLL